MRQVTRKGLMTMAAATGVLAAASGAAHADSGATGHAAGSPGVLSGNTVQVPVDVPVNVCGNTVNVVGILNPSVGNSCAHQGGSSSDGYGDSGGHGGSHADGYTEGSPGVLSGNTVQAPVHVPVNVCGNSVNVLAAGNAAQGNDCAHQGGSSSDGYGDSGGHGGSHADGYTGGSPGVGSGNHVQVPVHVPVNVCGNSVDILGAGNATEGNDCANDGPGRPGDPGDPGNPGHPGNPEHPGDEPGTPDDHTPDRPSAGDRPGTHSFTQPRHDAQLAQTGSELPMGLVLPVGAGALLAGAVLYRKARTAA
ncbi:chaplin [Streptomyces sp. NPDC051740]|uniref:chaplin n=1 Tax=Streptomyces sp. NPDC051740 TaxID=3365673 RepID=UPI00378A7B31